MSIDDHHADACRVLKQTLAACLAPHGVITESATTIDDVMEYIISPYSRQIDIASEALEGILRATRLEAAESLVNAIRSAEGIDPFIIDEAVQRWLRPPGDDD